MDSSKANEEMELDWIQVRQDMSKMPQQETTKEKMIRKIQENPFVPIGCMVTLGALSYGLWSFRTGQRKMSQYMMRLRVAAQGFTIFALIAGIGIAAKKNLNKTNN